MSKFQYPIYPDRTYTLTYENFKAEVSGEEIMAALYRELYLEKLWENAADLVAKQNTVRNTESGQDENPSMTP